MATSQSPLLWHNLSATAALKELQSDSSLGLRTNVAAKRLQEHGRNELIAHHGVSPWKILLSQFANVLIIILLIATGLSLFLGHGVESIAIAIIVLFAVILGFLQEYKAERAIESLQELASPKANVLRNGSEVEIAAKDVVPGDILLLSAGDTVCADARVLESVNLKADESSLTGESIPVTKFSEKISQKDTALGDRKNMLYSGTAITYGRGMALVTATGMQTEIGNIAGLLQSVTSSKTPLQKNLAHIGNILARSALVIVLGIMALGFFRGQPLLEMFIFGIALAVAVVPEALPAVVTISLSIGVQRMVKRNALVRKLPAVETLGSTTVICSDKTGTLTRNEMTIRQLYCNGQVIEVSGSGYEPKGSFSIDEKEVSVSSTLSMLLKAGTLSSDATIFKRKKSWEIHGDPTEGAIVVAAAKAGLKKETLDREYKRVSEIPFTSESKRMTTFHSWKKKEVAFSKGAPEVILQSCTHQLTENGLKKLDAAEKRKIQAQARLMAKHALRVLAISMKEHVKRDEGEEGLTFLGLVGMIDPPRDEVRDAVAKCHQAGIRVIMITGDHPVTAEAVAKELGILQTGKTIIGSKLEKMHQKTLEKEVKTIEVFARVAPEHKLRVVTALQKHGHIVAMTGDGVNDAPALKKADIGIAMGITGTDVSKEAAAMILTDDNFASIVAAVEEGRGMFGNIKKYLMYLLSANVGEILLITVTSLLGMPPPLTAVQILFVNLATDGLPALALAIDPHEKDLMLRPPRNPKKSIFSLPVIFLMLSAGVWSMIANTSLFYWSLFVGKTMNESMTMVFVCLILIEFFKAYIFRSDMHSMFVGIFNNRWLNLSIVSQMLLALVIVYVPVFHDPLSTYALTLNDWIVTLIAACTIVPFMEILKLIVRSTWGTHRAL